jgi:type 1 glutamine amidotransferase
MRRREFLSTSAAVSGLAAAPAPDARDNAGRLFAPGRIRTLIISGANNHDWRATTPWLRKLLSDSGRFDVRVTEEPSGLTKAALSPYDLVVLDYNGPRWGEAAEDAVESFVSGGKGLVVVHGASYAFGDMEVLGDRHVRTGIREPAWPAYAKMTGARWTGEEPKTGHGRRHVFRIDITKRDHPITKGLAESYLVSDELYHRFRMTSEVHVLAAAFDDPGIGGTGKTEPLIWSLSYGRGRVFHTALGHDLAALQEPGFVLTFLRGAEWAATRAVTLPAVWPAEQPADPVRVLVVTGGHDHEASFYEVFEDHWHLTVNINPHPIAYNREIAKHYDVLVVYDSIQDLPEKQKEHLRQFVESGKGVVALHHAIVDFWQWPWWYKDVIGGRYLLKPDGGSPASTFLHDQELRVTPVGEHPILKGIPPMHIFDETYKGMWISPGVKVLLRTDHPTSDGPVAWVSPYEKSRVVYIQLGHGRQAHEHPCYRDLVRNAILWSGGR